MGLINTFFWVLIMSPKVVFKSLSLFLIIHMKKLLIATALLASSSAVFAAGIYAGGSIGHTRGGNIDCDGTTECSKNSAGGKAFVGYQINDMFSVEASYFDLGTMKFADATDRAEFKSTGYGVRGLASFPFTKDFSGFVGLGINRVKSKVSATLGTLSGSADNTSTKPSFAVGVDYSLTTALKLRGEIENTRFDAGGTDGSYNVTNFSIGLKYSF